MQAIIDENERMLRSLRPQAMLAERQTLRARSQKMSTDTLLALQLQEQAVKDRMHWCEDEVDFARAFVEARVQMRDGEGESESESDDPFVPPFGHPELPCVVL